MSRDMSKYRIVHRGINPALLTEILDDQGHTAFWYRDGAGQVFVVTDAPSIGVVATALAGLSAGDH
jgi:hypothetical protein